ncbi:plasmid pRiA4b ORF-3 family protein [Catenulispora pinisilvae]|uniref:plasmid pRiA4b ORF-3 family protein n=1 Tax=Catenulispora pinisilvae TaxID=2705253 RepID=UPI001E2B5D1B|nr:plasmid pRiA4b ORF-3 family protein [Catenulispora pinisilvae]
MEQVQALVEWIGAGRKLTQTGRLTLADARKLVPLLGTADRIDPVVGGRVYRTQSSQELPRLNLLVEWAKAAGLIRVVVGRLVPVRKNAKLLSESERLRAALFEAFAKIPAEAVVPSRWITSLVLPAFRQACTELKFLLGSGDWVLLGVLQSAVWGDLAPRFVLDHLDRERLDRLREITARDTAHIVALWRALGAIEDDEGRVRLSGTVLGAVMAARDGTEPGEELFQVRVTLDDTDPQVWRRVLVPASIRLDRLHGVLQAALGWTDSHLHVFIVGEARYGWRDPDFDEDIAAEDTVRLADIAGAGTVVGYEYDFGDGWEHEILVEAVVPAESGIVYPRCVDGAAACPPEDCGGTWGYRDLRETLADPGAADHQEMLDWLGIEYAGQFDPAAFDVDAANRRIAADWITRGTRGRG